MNKLYAIRLSVGLPLQRVYRSHRTVVCTGATKPSHDDCDATYFVLDFADGSPNETLIEE